MAIYSEGDVVFTRKGPGRVVCVSLMDHGYGIKYYATVCIENSLEVVFVES